jgi:hypothetical protein
MVNMKKVIKFMVSDEAFQDAIHLPCYKIPYIDSTGIDSAIQFDFIIINNKNGNELIRNFMRSGENLLEYTSCFDGDNCNDIALTVIMTLLYQSIMWIRYGTYIEKKLFSHKDFPAQRLKREINLIESILKLCEEKMSMEKFMTILNQYENNTDDFFYNSAYDILEKYIWRFELTEIRKEKIGLIKSSLDEIIDLLEDKSKWKEIYKVGYKIHNEPRFIYENTNEF